MCSVTLAKTNELWVRATNISPGLCSRIALAGSSFEHGDICTNLPWEYLVSTNKNEDECFPSEDASDNADTSFCASTRPVDVLGWKFLPEISAYAGAWT